MRAREREREIPNNLYKKAGKQVKIEQSAGTVFCDFSFNTAMGDRTYVRESMKEKRMLYEPASKYEKEK